MSDNPVANYFIDVGKADLFYPSWRTLITAIKTQNAL